MLTKNLTKANQSSSFACSCSSFACSWSGCLYACFSLSLSLSLSFWLQRSLWEAFAPAVWRHGEKYRAPRPLPYALWRHSHHGERTYSFRGGRLAHEGGSRPLRQQLGDSLRFPKPSAPAWSTPRTAWSSGRTSIARSTLVPVETRQYLGCRIHM